MKKNLQGFEIACVLFGILWLYGCAITQKTLVQRNDSPRKIVVFFDGTANDERSDSNIKKLHSLVTLQKRSDITSIYIEGVGANGKFIGMATGWGIGARVRMAYTFLFENYRSEDEIFIFGFSRGSYSGRILASLLNYAGLPNIQNQKKITAAEISDIVYDSFKGKKSDETRRTDIKRALSGIGLPASPSIHVTVLALWDTVEALGLPDYEANIDIPNNNYGDQLCNVKRALHAVSIDDDRERIFTPILLTRKHLLQECSDLKNPDVEGPGHINKVVDEVWFSGAHADIGGGYQDSILSGVSLNWMIGQLRNTGLLPKDAAVPEDRYGISHDPEHGFPWNILYKKQSRDLRRYAESSVYNEKKLKLHRSVIERLEKMKPKGHEFPWLSEKAYPGCFEETPHGYRYITGNRCFDIIE